MRAFFKNKKAMLWISMACACVLVVGLAACAPKAQSDNADKGGSSDPTDIQKPEPNDNGIITADAWKDIYPDQYATYEANSQYDNLGAYQDIFPQIKTIWNGTPFAKAYNKPDGHTLTLRDVQETGRAPKTANCLTCKSSEYVLKQKSDPSLDKSDIHAMEDQVSEPVSCYDCHENSPAQGSTAIRQFFIDAVGDDASKLPDNVTNCGQCHNEYQMDTNSGAVVNPWKGLANATPEKVLEYENQIGFADYTNPDNGTKQIKVKHPDFETMYGGNMSPMAKQGYSCADCHMGKATDDNGTQYTNHNFGSPLDNESLLQDDCSQCHKDLKSEVEAKHQVTTDRLNTIADKLVTVNTKLTEAVKSGSKSEDDLNKLRDLNRTSQFYWDWVMVENGKGAHNSAEAMDTLNKSEQAADQAISLLGA